MTTHTFRHEKSTVTIGWDRPLQGYFMLIDLDGRQVYSNLDDPVLGGLGGLSDTPTFFQKRLLEKGIPMPAGLLDVLRRDGETNSSPYERDWG